MTTRKEEGFTQMFIFSLFFKDPKRKFRTGEIANAVKNEFGFVNRRRINHHLQKLKEMNILNFDEKNNEYILHPLLKCTGKKLRKYCEDNGKDIEDVIYHNPFYFLISQMCKNPNMMSKLFNNNRSDYSKQLSSFIALTSIGGDVIDRVNPIVINCIEQIIDFIKPFQPFLQNGDETSLSSPKSNYTFSYDKNKLLISSNNKDIEMEMKIKFKNTKSKTLLG